jgi:hypothetical protein
MYIGGGRGVEYFRDEIIFRSIQKDFWERREKILLIKRAKR